MIISVHKLTIIAGLIAFTTIVTTYLASTLSHKLPFFMPTISETGDQAPEGGIFVYGLSWTAFLLLMLNLTIHRRYMFMISQAQIEQIDAIAPRVPGWITRVKVSTSFGVIAAFGLHLLASFRSNSTPSVHFLGAGLLFFSTWIWMVANIHFLRQIAEFHDTKSHMWIKLFAVTVCSIAALGLLLCTLVALSSVALKADAWKAFALFEWVFVFSLAVFCLSFWSDFTKFVLVIDLEPVQAEEAQPNIQSPLLPQDKYSQV